MKGFPRHLVFLVLSLFAFSFFPQNSFAITLYKNSKFSFDFKGYYKNLFFVSKETATDDPFVADLNRLRTEWDLRVTDIFSTKVIWDNEIVVGDFVNTPEFDRFQQRKEIPYLDLESQLVKKNDFYYGMGLYRAYFRIDVAPMAMIVGRQKVDWGVIHLVSPAALYTPLTLFNIEKDEIVGTTAANLIFTLPHGIKVNPVYSLEADFDQSRTGLRVTKTVGGFDVSVLGGRFLRDTIFGVDFSGQIKGAGIRGEFIYDHGIQNNDFVQLALEMDYAIKKFYFDVEYFFNSQGTNNPLTALPFPATANQIKSVHQNFLAFQFIYEALPQLHLLMLDVIDLNGGSIFINPEIKYAPYSWLEFLAGVQVPVGKTNGEFTPLKNFYYFQTQMFF